MFFNVTGTRFTRSAEVEIRGPTARQETQTVPKRMLQRPTQYREALQRRNDTGNHSQNVRDENSHESTTGNEPPVPNEYFLEMKQQIRSMQDKGKDRIHGDMVQTTLYHLDRSDIFLERKLLFIGSK